MSSVYLTILTESGERLGDKYETLGAGWELFNNKLIIDGYDLRPYIFCPEGYMSEEEYLSMNLDEPKEVTERTLELYRHISKDEFFPIQKVLAEITAASSLANNYKESDFLDDNKEEFIAELNELKEEIHSNLKQGLNIQLFCAD